MSPAVVPVAKALYLCDEVVLDPATNKINLSGLLNSIPVKEESFPVYLDQLCVFALLTNGLGHVPASVEIMSAQTGETIFATPTHELVFPSRSRIVYACIRILNCPFPEPGNYVVELYCGKIFVDDRLFQVRIGEGDYHE